MTPHRNLHHLSEQNWGPLVLKEIPLSQFVLNITQSNIAELQRAEGQIFLKLSEHLKIKKGH